jgi:hypothetical protein
VPHELRVYLRRERVKASLAEEKALENDCREVLFLVKTNTI